MRQDVFNISFLLHLLACVVQEEIDKDSVEFPLRVGVFLLDLPPQKFDAPDTAAPDLDLHVLTRIQLGAAGNPRLQAWRIPQTVERLQHLRDTVVGKHGQGSVDVVEGAVRGPVETGPEIGDHDLCALVQLNLLAVEDGGVAEVRKALDQEVHERRRGVVRA
jgi:hypothetical protein